MTVVQAALIAVYYGFYASQPLILLMGPSNFGAIIGLVVGLIMGDVSKGVTVGAWIQLMELGTVHYGGTKPSDQFAASIIAIPVAIAANLPTSVALVLASLFGALGFLLDTLWKSINTSVWNPRIDKAVEALDYGAINRAAGLYPMLIRLAISTPIVFGLVYLGTPAMKWVMACSPAWLVTGLSNTGALLPALGFSLFLAKMGKPVQLPFFIVGYFVMVFLDLPIMGMAIFGAFLAFLSIVWTDTDFFKGKEARDSGK